MNHEQMIIPPAQPGSWEDVMHQAGQTDKLLIFNEDNHHLFKHFYDGLPYALYKLIPTVSVEYPFS